MPHVWLSHLCDDWWWQSLTASYIGEWLIFHCGDIVSLEILFFLSQLKKKSFFEHVPFFCNNGIWSNRYALVGLPCFLSNILDKILSFWHLNLFCFIKQTNIAHNDLWYCMQYTKHFQFAQSLFLDVFLHTFLLQRCQQLPVILQGQKIF